MDKFGFIILRHVDSAKTNEYWQECYHCIRNVYPDTKIVIIDDDSNREFVTNGVSLINTIIIESEFKKRGELLPYYYYLQNKWFENAVIIHDSVFIKSDIILNYIDMKVSYKFLWHFASHSWDMDENILPLIRSLDNHANLEDFYHKKIWNGCFGGMTLINHVFLTYVNNKYHMCNLLDKITIRENRCSFERVIACMFQYENKNMDFGILGDIHQYCKWGYSFEEYMNNSNDSTNQVIKVWTGR